MWYKKIFKILNFFIIVFTINSYSYANNPVYEIGANSFDNTIIFEAENISGSTGPIENAYLRAFPPSGITVSSISPQTPVNMPAGSTQNFEVKFSVQQMSKESIMGPFLLRLYTSSSNCYPISKINGYGYNINFKIEEISPNISMSVIGPVPYINPDTGQVQGTCKIYKISADDPEGPNGAYSGINTLEMTSSPYGTSWVLDAGGLKFYNIDIVVRDLYPPSTIYRVVAEDEAGNVAILDKTDVTPPLSPILILPTSNNIVGGNVNFKWDAVDPSGIIGYSFILDQLPNTMPDLISEGNITEQAYSNLSTGTYYFHIIAQDGAGNWSGPAHFEINVDNSLPEIISVNPEIVVQNNLLIILGTNFGNLQDDSKVIFENGLLCPVETWSDTNINCRIPHGAITDFLKVVTSKGESSGILIKVNNLLLKGTIFDETAIGDEPLNFVDIIIKNLDGLEILSIAQTDLNGKFEVWSTDISDGLYLLEVSKRGYESFFKEIALSNAQEVLFSTTLTKSNSYISFEAEDMDNLATVSIDPNNVAWAKMCITSQHCGTNTHSFFVGEEGDYTFWFRIRLDHNTNYAMDISIDDETVHTIGYNSDSYKFEWINRHYNDYSDRVIIHLASGKHTISMVFWEMDTMLDSVILTDNLDYIPPDVPPDVLETSWENIVTDGFGDPKNHEAKMMDANGSLYVSTSNSNLHPAIFKSYDGINFKRVYELKTPYGNGYYMYRTLDLKYLNLGLNSGLYAVSDDWYGTCYLTKLNPDNTFTTLRLGNRDWWTKDIIAFNNYAYAAFYNDWNLWFTMRRSSDPMNSSVATSWLNVSQPAFGKDSSNKQYANMDSDASCVFRGYLYIGTYNYGYFGRTTTGAQIWRTNDGTTWEKVVGDGFGSTNRSSISHMTVFGGYLYATTAEAFGPNYIYRTKDGVNWELAYQGMNNEPYIGDITSYMGRLYLTTYNWGGRVYSSPDGITWTPVSNSYINNNSANSLVGDLHPFKGFMYVNTRNMTTGTNIFRAKICK